MANSLQISNRSKRPLKFIVEGPDKKKKETSFPEFTKVWKNCVQPKVQPHLLRQTSHAKTKNTISKDSPLVADEVKTVVAKKKFLPVASIPSKQLEEECEELISLTDAYEASKRYVPHILIDGGSYGKVYQGFSDRGSPVAIKEHADQKESYQIAIAESSILKELEKLQVPHRLHFRDVYERLDPTEPRTQPKSFHRTLVTDFLPTGNVHQNHLSPSAVYGMLSMNDFITIARQHLEFLDHLSKASIIHGDVKPANIIFEMYCRHLTVLDYGMAHKVNALFSDFFQTCYYRAPEVILRGPIDCSVDMWSLGCTLFELFTGFPLFRVLDHPTDLKISSNTMLQKMAQQIGMPPWQFLKNCKDVKSYYKLGESIEFAKPELFPPIFPWKAAIQYASFKKSIPVETIEEIIQLLDRMLRYEKRASPEELLTLPLFKKDISFHLSNDFSAQDVITIYSFYEIDFHTKNGEIFSFPNPIFQLDKKQRITRNCFHIPRDPNDQYFVFVTRAGITYVPEMCTLREGETLSFKFVECIVPATPVTEENHFPEISSELASTFSSELLSEEWFLFGGLIPETSVIGSDSSELEGL